MVVGRKRNSDRVTKITIAAVAVAAIAFGAYKLSSGSVSDLGGSESTLKTLPTGIDPNKPVRNAADVEAIIAKWVEENPAAILEAVVKMQQKMMKDQMASAQQNISEKLNELFKDSSDPEYAPKGYDVTIVEFFDYNCGYCKRAQASLEDLLRSDKKVRVVYKEYPILGQASHDLAKVAIAVNKVSSSSYKKFHDALMKSSARTTDAAIEVAKSVGINVGKLKSYLDKNGSDIERKIQENLTLGSSIGVTGTPGFVIGEELIPGAVPVDQLKQKIEAVRK